jgi:hypothetical protein
MRQRPGSSIGSQVMPAWGSNFATASGFHPLRDPGGGKSRRLYLSNVKPALLVVVELEGSRLTTALPVE